ncbi:hypothetical protein HMPREF1199_01658 [Hoylesella oralis CC98A]|nr:hypothetical protein HMPREF1199_01658 [Hoylesella oralis CC98A]
MKPYHFLSSLYALGKLFAFRISVQFLITLVYHSAIAVFINIEEEKNTTIILHK